MLNNKSILVTGGTGSFGSAFLDFCLKKYKKIKKIVVFSRDELKQYEMRQQFPNLNISQAPFAPLTDLCRQPWTRAYVTVDGYVTPCCEISDPKRYNYGNTIQSKFAEVYNGLETNSWRQKFLVESPPAYEGCTAFTLRKKIV